MTYHYKDLESFCSTSLQRCNVREKDANITAKVLVNADMRGIHSHGLIRLINYIDCLLSDGIKAQATPQIVSETASHAVVDGRQGLGIPVSVYATDIACNKAHQTGIGIVNVFNSHHHGACGFFSQHMTESKLIGMAMSTGDIIMAATGSASRAIGNNPFSYAIPAGKYRAICYDVAMSAVAAGKISIAAQEGHSIPFGWLLDPNGNPTQDPSNYEIGGALVPFGEHKGYGLSIMVECLAGLLSGGAMLSDIHAWNKNPLQSGNVGHMFIALDPSQLNPGVDLQKRVELMIEKLSHASCAPGVERILYPGQLEHEREDLAKTQGITLPHATISSLHKVAAQMNLSFC